LLEYVSYQRDVPLRSQLRSRSARNLQYKLASKRDLHWIKIATRKLLSPCRRCRVSAPLPVRIIDTIVSKYADHNPLYRQSAILLRDAGIDISRATMCGWMMMVGGMLMPVVAAMRRELLAGRHPGR
jgi:transposase